MRPALEKLNEYKWVITTVTLVLTFGWWLMGIQTDASEAKKKVDSIEATYKSIEQIAQQVQINQQSLADPKRMLADWLITMGEDPAQVKFWMSMPVGLKEINIADTGAARYMLNIPFILNNGNLPWVGIRAVVKMVDTTVEIRIFDTLWDRRVK